MDDYSLYSPYDHLTMGIVSREQLDMLSSSSNSWVRRAAARNLGATKDQLDKLMNDVDPDVRNCALRNPNADPESVAYFKMKYLV